MLHHTAVCSVQVWSTKQVTPPNGQTIEYKFKSIRASVKHVVVHGV